MKTTANLESLLAEDLYSDLSYLLSQLSEMISRKQNYLLKIKSKEDSNKNTIAFLEKDINLLTSIETYWKELLFRYQIQSTIIPIQLWWQAIKESELTGTKGCFNLYIEISDYTITSRYIYTQ